MWQTMDTGRQAKLQKITDVYILQNLYIKNAINKLIWKQNINKFRNVKKLDNRIINTPLDFTETEKT